MMEPKVRQMIVCEDARTRQGSGRKIDVFGIINKVFAESFPFNLTLAVYLCLTECRGSGQGRIVVTELGAEKAAYIGDLHPFEFGSDPVALHPFVIRIPSCELSRPGLYEVSFVYNEVALDSYAILVEESV